MYPALEQAVLTRFNNDPDRLYPFLAAQFAEDITKFPPLHSDVVAAFTRVSRLDFITTLWSQISPYIEVDEQIAEKLASRVLKGDPATIWVEEDGMINSTATALSAFMVDMGLPDKGQGRRGRALVIGSGIGFVPAILQELGFEQILGVEVREGLALFSSDFLRGNNFDRVTIVHANAMDWMSEGENTFDTILVFAAVKDPEVVATMLTHLNPGGNLVVPTGPSENALLMQYCRSGDGTKFLPSQLALTEFTPFVMPADPLPE